MFASAALTPRPPMTILVSKIMIVGSVTLLAAAMAVLLIRGFRD
jgi:hypothetical protein